MPEHFPAMEEVEKADRLQIAKWYQFLPKNEVGSDQNIMDRITDRFMNLGGLTPGLNKKIQTHTVNREKNLEESACECTPTTPSNQLS